MSVLKGKLEYLIYLGLIVLMYFFQVQSWNGEYLDTDCYFHALRMVYWFENPSFFEQKMWWSNYPFGEISHWTRVIYIIWGLITLPFLLVDNIKDAVFNAGLFIPPLFLILSAMFLIASMRDFFNVKFRLLAFILLFVQANFMRTAYFYRPDHHIIFVFLSVLIFYFINLFIKEQNDKTLTKISILLALALWLSVEGVFLFIFLALFLLITYWCFDYKYDYLLNKRLIIQLQ
jgi:asparagine N-glycosylation enzyme membrane subunit Stt3